MNLDGFAAVPSGSGELEELPVSFGDEVVVYAIGPAVVRRPGLPAVLGELSERLGVLPWMRLCEPALALARDGVPLPAMHARTLEMLGDLYRLGRGAELFCVTAGSLVAGEALVQPGLVDALGVLAEEGASSVYRGTLAEEILRSRRASCSPRRISPTTARSGGSPVLVPYYGRRVATRGGLSGVPELLPRLPELRDAYGDRPRARARRGAARRTTRAASTRRTWSPSTRTVAPACSPTRSVSARGYGSPGSTSSSTTCSARPRSPSASPRPATTCRAAWRRLSPSTPTGSSSRSGRPDRRACEPRSPPCSPASSTKGSTPRPLSPARASTPAPTLIDAEPGVDETALAELESRGRTVRRWDDLHHYFGGVGCVGRAGAAGDPRRSGAAVVV